jgi:hypothetical protein
VFTGLHVTGPPRARTGRYGRFYAPLALGMTALAFVPPFDDVDATYEHGTTVHMTYGTVFQMAARPAGGPAVLGIMLFAVLVVFLVAGAFRDGSVALPIGIAIVAALVALMLITKPGTGTPTPALSDAGTAGLILVICTAALAVVHAIHLTVLNRRPVSYGPVPGAGGTAPPAAPPPPR